jgi:hypothetical protein
MANILVYGFTDLGFHFSRLFLMAGNRVKMIYSSPNGSHEPKPEQRIVTAIPFGMLNEFDYANTDFIFICDIVVNYGIFNSFSNQGSGIVLVDCLFSQGHGNVTELEGYDKKLVRGFFNVVTNKQHISYRYPRKETFFCTDNPAIKTRVKTLGLSIGYHCIYVGELSNESLITNLVKLQNSVALHEYPNRDVTFYISVM